MNATGRLQQFKAAIQKTGVNFFVEVPARVSSSMRSFTHSGRIRVAGQLNQTPMQGTLIPVAGGRHRLFVNGGTRSAAKVGLGDVVSIELRPTKPNEVVAPEDLTAGLHRVPGALDAFNAQPVSRRRELIRYVDGARTPQSRERRIAKTADHILGKEGLPRSDSPQSVGVHSGRAPGAAISSSTRTDFTPAADGVSTKPSRADPHSFANYSNTFAH